MLVLKIPEGQEASYAWSNDCFAIEPIYYDPMDGMTAPFYILGTHILTWDVVPANVRAQYQGLEQINIEV